MNTNDFSRCKVGDKLWCIQFGACEFAGMAEDPYSRYPVRIKKNVGTIFVYTIDGKWSTTDASQSLYFSNPNIIAPPEPPRLPDYKPGQWIAVWKADHYPIMRKFVRFEETVCIAANVSGHSAIWQNHCTIEELPEVLAKWGGQK